jgi:Rieske Fe-S protein
MACLGGGVASLSLSGCATTHYVSGAIETNGITVLKSDFINPKKQTNRQFIIVLNDKLAFPIYLYRFSDTEYSAIWMQCSHQGNELQALGDQLHCPAHGSEFDNRGKVSQGPASHPLRSFAVKADGDNIFIDLRAV